jgi:hypothetical protein
VLEHFFDGELRSSWDASANQVRELKERLVEWFDAWSAPDPVAHEVRLYLDTDFNAGVLPVDLAALSVSYQQPDLETFRERDRPTVRKLRRRYTGALLYSDRVIAIDPLAFWVQQEVLQTDLTMARAAIYMHWEALRRVEPLLRSGCLLLAPFPAPEELHTLIERSFHSPPESRLLETFSGLAALTAERTRATLFDFPWQDAKEQIDAALSPRDAKLIDLRVVHALEAVELPILTDVPLETLVQIRESEQAFVDWRAELRSATRLLTIAAGAPGFKEEAQAVLTDAIVPRVNAVRETVSRSTALQHALKEQPIRVTFGAIAAGGAAAASDGTLRAALLSSVASGIAYVLAAPLLRTRPSGAAAVIAELDAAT